MEPKSVIKPFQVIDEYVLRQHSKIVKKWEEKGRNKYVLSGALSLLGTRGFFHMCGGLFNGYSGVYLGANLGLDVGPLLSGNSHEGIRETNGKRIVTNPLIYYVNKGIKTSRLPIFLTGLGFTGKGLFDMYDHFLGSGSSSAGEGLENISLGLGTLIPIASAAYVRDGDPKILDKAPFWKSLYEGAKNKIKEFGQKLPEPVPQPIPVRSFALEDRLNV